MRYLFSGALLIMSISAQEKNFVTLPANITFTFSNTNNGMPQGPIQKFEYEVIPAMPQHQIDNSFWQAFGGGALIKVAAGAGISAGLCVLGYLEYCAHQLEKTTGWQTWKRDIALVSLYQLAQAELIKQLLADMQERYHAQGAQPAIIMACMNDIKNERTNLEHLQQVLGLISWSGLHTVLGRSSTLQATLAERLARLAFVEKILMQRLDAAAKL